MKNLTICMFIAFMGLALTYVKAQVGGASKTKVANTVEVVASDKAGGDRVTLRRPANVIPISRTIVAPDGETTYNICSAMQITPTVILTEAHCLAKNSRKNVPGFAHKERIHALPTLQKNGLWRLDLSATDKNVPTVPNAQVILYRPGYEPDGTAMSYAFDMALIKLDSQLRANPSMIPAEVQQAFAQVSTMMPELAQLTDTNLTQASNQVLVSLAKDYQNFLHRKLEKFDLLAMTPDVVQRELGAGLFQIYYFDQQAGSLNRGPLKICTSPSLGVYPNNSHRMKFDFDCPQGTSGSPVLDTDRNLVVSIGGEALLSDDVCQWVKTYDAQVKCLVARGNTGYQETSATASWGK